MTEGLAQRVGAFVLRLVSIASGALIIRHEVYGTAQAEIAVIALGMWLIGVPPALWLDALRRAGRTLEDSTTPRSGQDRNNGDDS